MNQFDIEDEKIINIKTNFQKILDLKNQINDIFNNLQIKINKIKEYYELFKKDNNNNLFLFGLDSLNFQSKLIDIELEHLKSFYNLINNKMYGSYYKLFIIFRNFINKTFYNYKKIKDLINIDTEYPVYKDLEQYKNYDFEITAKIHDKILENGGKI